MKSILVFLFSFIIVSSAFGQTDVLGSTYEGDTSSKPNLMLIPCPERNYMSDADMVILKNTELNGKDLIKTVIDELYFNVHAQLLGSYEVYTIADDQVADHQKDLASIMSGIGYQYDTPTPAVKERNKNVVSRYKAKLENYLAAAEGASVTAGELTTEFVRRAKKEQYYNTVLHSNEMLPYYNEKYNADLFIFLNQIEIKTVYATQQDRYKYFREIWVHFSIYDKESKLYFGDVAKIKFNSRASNLQTIIRNTFPKVGEYISFTLP